MPLRASVAQRGRAPPPDDRSFDRVVKDFTFAKSEGYNPAKDIVVTNTSVGDKFKGRVPWINFSPCITATLGKNKGLYISTKGAPIDTTDLACLQGLPKDFFDHIGCGVSATHYGHQLGNAVSCNVMMRVLPAALKAAGLIRSLPEEDYWAAAVRTLRFQGAAQDAKRAMPKRRMPKKA